MPWDIAQTQVIGTSHQRSRPSSRVRSHAAAVTATIRKLIICGRIDRFSDAAPRAATVSSSETSGSTHRRATR